MDMIQTIALLGTPIMISAWALCTLNYLRITRLFREKKSWGASLVSMVGLLFAYLTYVAFLVSGDSSLWTPFALFAVVGVLPFLLGTMQTYFELKKVMKK